MPKGRSGGRSGGRRAAGGSRARSMARMMAVRRQMRQRRRRRRRRRMLMLVGGMAVLGYAGYKLSQKDVKRVEEHTGKKADELTDEQLEQAMEQLGIEQETMTDEEWAQAEKADAEPDYLGELERLSELWTQGILSDEEFTAKKQQVLGL